MSAYAALAPEEPPKLLVSADIDKLFQRKRGWFEHTRVRERLYRKGFPHPVERGRWSAAAIAAWMAGAGTNPDNVPPDPPRRRRGGPRPPRLNGYADA